MSKHLRKSEREDGAKLCPHYNPLDDCPICNEEILKCPKCQSANVIVNRVANATEDAIIDCSHCEDCHHEWNFK